MAEGASASVLHQEMVIELSQHLNPKLDDIWKNFIGLLKASLDVGPAKMKSITTMHDAVSELEIKGMVSKGSYRILKEIFGKMEHAICSDIIDKFTKRIEKINSDTLTMLMCIAEQPPASDQNMLCETLRKSFTSKVEEICRSEDELMSFARGNQRSEEKMGATLGCLLKEHKMKITFETSPNIIIKCIDISPNAKSILLNMHKTKLEEFFQVNFITEDVLKECNCESIAIKIFVLEDHQPDREMKQEQDKIATKKDVKDAKTELDKEIKYVKDEMPTREDIRKMLQEEICHLDPTVKGIKSVQDDMARKEDMNKKFQELQASVSHLTSAVKEMKSEQDDMAKKEDIRKILQEEISHLVPAETEGTESSVIKRIRLFSQLKRSPGRPRASTVNNRKPKDTRRVQLGWKHMFQKNAYQLVSDGKGGGKHSMDAHKNTTLEELDDGEPQDKTNHVVDVAERDDDGDHEKGRDRTDLSQGELDQIDEVERNIDQESTEEYQETDTPTITFRSRRLPNRPLLPRLPVARPPVAIDLSDEDDEAFKSAVKASLEMTKPVPTFESVMKWWMQKTLTPGEPQQIIVQRDKILMSTLRAISKPNFEWLKPIKVVFSGEIGEDLGGPKREFLREVIMAIQDEIVTGPDINKTFVHDIAKIAKETFETAGKLIGLSLLNEGPGMPVLNKEVYRMMTGLGVSDDISLEECIFEEETKSRLNKLKQSSTQESLTQCLDEDCDWYMDQGLMPFGVKFEKKEEFLKNAIENILFYRVHGEITQFIQGLNSMGNLFEAVQYAPEAMMELFVHKNIKLTFDKFRKLYIINFSPDGSKARIRENDTIFCLESFLMDCEGGQTAVSLGDVLAFWTGATSPPPLGFSKKLEINFTENEVHVLPVAHTCGMVLELKRGLTDPDRFKEDMVKAVTWTGGFHLA